VVLALLVALAHNPYRNLSCGHLTG
jgi:hypothetical protein